VKHEEGISFPRAALRTLAGQKSLGKAINPGIRFDINMQSGYIWQCFVAQRASTAFPLSAWERGDVDGD